MIKKNNVLTNVVLMRFFTILIVVLGHSIIFYSTSWDIFEPEIESAFLDYLKDYINVFQMPLFIFISGYVYSYNRIEQNKYQDKILFITNKFKRLMIPFLSVAILYVIPIRLFVDYSPYQGESLLSLLVKHAIVGRDIGNLWYLQALFNIFVVFYSFEKVFRKVPILLNFVILISVSVFSAYVPNVFNLHLALRYFVYFYLGYVAREAKLENKAGGRVIGVLFILQFIGLAFGYSARPLMDSSVITGLTLGFNVLGSIFSSLFYYYLFTKISQSYEKLYENDLISYIDGKSFGIYLFHSPLLYIVLYYLADSMINPYIMVVILFVVMLFGSIIITTLIEKSDNFGFIIGKQRVKAKI